MVSGSESHLWFVLLNFVLMTCLGETHHVPHFVFMFQLSLSLFCEFILKQSTVYSLFRGEATEHDLFMAGNQGG